MDSFDDYDVAGNDWPNDIDEDGEDCGDDRTYDDNDQGGDDDEDDNDEDVDEAKDDLAALGHVTPGHDIKLGVSGYHLPTPVILVDGTTGDMNLNNDDHEDHDDHDDHDDYDHDTFRSGDCRTRNFVPRRTRTLGTVSLWPGGGGTMGHFRESSYAYL